MVNKNLKEDCCSFFSLLLLRLWWYKIFMLQVCVCCWWYMECLSYSTCWCYIMSWDINTKTHSKIIFSYHRLHSFLWLVDDLNIITYKKRQHCSYHRQKGWLDHLLFISLGLWPEKYEIRITRLLEPRSVNQAQRII